MSVSHQYPLPPFSVYLMQSMSVFYLLSLKALLQQISAFLATCCLHDSEHIAWSNFIQIKEKKRNISQVYISFIFFFKFLNENS